jgi:hypothetical protein
MKILEYIKLSNVLADFHSDNFKLTMEQVNKKNELDNTLDNLKKILVSYGYELVDMMIHKDYATVLHNETNKFYKIRW